MRPQLLLVPCVVAGAVCQWYVPCGDCPTASVEGGLESRHRAFARPVCFDTVHSSESIGEPTFVFHATVSWAWSRTNLK
ncbi:MAG TPA: hypothetical protein DEF45_19300 [Rhodopirellula sp.]|nr:hypothetical protein [Rhodopirellula sp.]